jgi:hypothetical protein
MMILVYVDDCIIIGKDMDDIEQFVLRRRALAHAKHMTLYC